MDFSFLETPRTHPLLPWLFPLLKWRMTGSKRAIHLTFDDGPTPGVTDRILDILDEHNSKAGFFCIGTAAESHPEIVQRIVDGGHTLGNHTYSHVSGWSCSARTYLDEIARCDDVLPPLPSGRPRPFRPPYARLGILAGLRLCLRRSIVMWDINSMDYRDEETADSVARRVMAELRPGSIVLLHDSPITGPKTIAALPVIIKAVHQRGWELKALN